MNVAVWNESLMTEPNRITSSKLARDVVALGRKYSKTGFPNPNREGCPSQSRLRAIANRDKRLTLADLPASHIVSCSPCFQEYERLRRASLLLRGVRIASVSLAAVALLFVTARFVWNHASPKINQTITKRLPTKRQQPHIVPLLLKVDLAAFSPTRGDGNAGFEKIHFPRKLLRAQFLLPLGMEAGEYEIRLQDSAGGVAIDAPAVGRVNDGITSVELDIDLANTTQRNFTLMIRPRGSSWRRFPLQVE
jgi:hypothetical protein